MAKLGTIIADFRTALATKMSIGATTGTLQSATDDDGVALPAGRYFFTIDGDNSQKEHISCELNGTDLTSIKSVSRQGVETSGTVREHRVGASVVITNFAHIKYLNDIVKGDSSSGENTFIIGDGENTDKSIIFDAGESSDKNPSLKYDSNNNQIIYRRYGEDSFVQIPLSLRGTYADYASLPTEASNGDIAVTDDDHKLYVYDSDTTTWVLSGGSSGAGTMYKTVKYGTEADGDDNKTFTLNNGSWPDEKFLLVYKNGILMENDADGDYTIIDSNTIEFNYEVKDTDKIVMIVVSVDLYNPAWNNVTEDILPDEDNLRDLGSSSKTFAELHLKTADGFNQATATPTAGKIPIADGSGKLDNGWIGLGFGDGSDGDLVISSGTTIIDLDGASYFEKNYSSISITGTGSLAFSNPHILGSVIVLKSKGDVTITSSASSAIDLRELGSQGSTTNGVFDALDHRAKTIYSNSYFYTLPNNPNSFNRQILVVTPGTQGADGYKQNGMGSLGKGAGGLIIKCGGNLNFTGVINASGKDGANGVLGDETGDGGGSGGDVVIAYKGTLIASSGTINNAGGKGGNGGTYVGTPRVGGDGAGSSSGAGGAGISKGTPNNGGIKAGGGGAGVTSSGPGTGGSGGASDGGLIIKYTF